MIVFLDYDGVVNSVMWECIHPPGEDPKLITRYADPHDNRVNNPQAVQWLSELCERYNASIVVTSTWRKWDNYKLCLINAGLREGVQISGKVSDNFDLSRAEAIDLYLRDHPEVGRRFIIIDDEVVDMSSFGYDNHDHFIQCTTNAGFQLEEFQEATTKIDNLLSFAVP